MNWLDIVLLVVLVLTAFLGLWKGIISMVIPIAGIVVGVILAGKYYSTVGGWLPISDPEHAKWAAYAIIIAIALILAVILAYVLRRFLKLAFLGWVDRVFGGVLGLALGGLISAAVMAACLNFGMGEGIIPESGIAKLFLDWLPAVLALLPPEFDSIREFFQ